ncbi:MAG: hypothetical protein AAGD96_02935 [Chloroflexota bacterium]
MNTIKRFSFLCGGIASGFLLLSLFFSTTLPANAQVEPEVKRSSAPVEVADLCREQPGANLLGNPSFEGQYTSYVPAEPLPDCPAGVCTTAQMPADWIPYWRSQKEFDNPDPVRFRQPEYKPACIGDEPCPFPERLRDGAEALQYFTFFSTHEGGAQQTIEVEKGATYCFSSWGHSWSAQDDGDAISGPDDGELYQKVGIDPTGGTDFRSSDIIWSDQETDPWGRIQYDEYGLFTISAVAEADEITVFVYSQPRHPTKHNNVYWDDAYLSKMQTFYTTTLTTTANINLFTTITDTVSVSQTIDFAITGTVDTPTLTWSVEISNTSPISEYLSITPTLSATTGNLTDSLSIQIDSTGLAIGNYGANIIISTAPRSDDSVFVIPVRVFIVDQITRTFLPRIGTGN